MSNFLTPFKKFLKNKNTVTIICIVIGVLTLVIGYNYRVSKATNLVTVPYAIKNIDKKTQITKDMIGHVKIPNSLVTSAKNILTSDKDVLNNYASYTTGIPAKSLFYKELVMKPEEMPDYAFMNMADGYTVYSLKVNNKTTYFNRIRPGDYIDLMVQMRDGNTITFGNLAFNLIDYMTYQHNQQDKYREWYTSMSLKMSNLAEIVHKANAGFDTFTTNWGESQQQNTQDIQKLQQELQQLLNSQKDKDTADKGKDENDTNK